MQLYHWDEETDGKLSEPAFYEKLAAMGYSVSLYHYPPGTYFPAHSHAVDKIDAVLSGEFKMDMQGESVVLRSGDYLLVPHGVEHSAEVIGDEPVVSLDAVKNA